MFTLVAASFISAPNRAVLFVTEGTLVDGFSLRSQLGADFADAPIIPRSLLEETVTTNDRPKELLHELKRSGVVTIAVSGRRNSTTLRAMLQVAGISEWVDFTVGAEARERGNPLPFRESCRLSAVPLDGVSLVVDLYANRSEYTRLGLLRVLEVDGPHQVTMMLYPHLVDADIHFMGNTKSRRGAA